MVVTGVAPVVAAALVVAVAAPVVSAAFVVALAAPVVTAACIVPAAVTGNGVRASRAVLATPHRGRACEEASHR
jgi:hypothetical protein